MKLYSLKERSAMYDGTGCEFGLNKFLIELYNYPTQEALDVRRVVLAYEVGNSRLGQRNLRLDMVRAAWEARTKLEDLIKARMEVEEEIIAEEIKMKPEVYKVLDNNRSASNAIQKISIFEKNLVYETRHLAGYKGNDEKSENRQPTLTSYEQIKKHIYDRVKAYYNNEFHYDLEKIGKEEKVETIGV